MFPTYRKQSLVIFQQKRLFSPQKKMQEGVPSFLCADPKKTLVQIRQELRFHGLKHSFRTRKECQLFLDSMRWPWDMPWRTEQKHVLDSFFDPSNKQLVLQAIFGGGKTTLLLAILWILVLQHHIHPSQIMVCAFNVAIKNEIKKKTRCLGKIHVCTYDSLIYQLCKSMNYPDLRLLNFASKRKYVLENLSRVCPYSNISFLFVDECQDLERECFQVLDHVFPLSKRLFVGDIFQCVQKEPRESMLWYLCHHYHSSTVTQKVIHMLDTPRVPSPVLTEIQNALIRFYPEMHSTIGNWTSSNPSFSQETTTPAIQWNTFKTYQDMFRRVLSTLQNYEEKEVMILTFSSAITVRGTCGDVARMRRFLASHGILVNSSHKRMHDDRVFLSTANSSKGLERNIVICVLTFPLEKAFSNFSNDLVMNLMTVALTRCKQQVTFFVPEHQDRTSEVLTYFDRCPPPSLSGGGTATHPKTKQPALDCASKTEPNLYDFSEMISMEHSVTTVLRQNILSFELRNRMTGHARLFQTIPLSEKRDFSYMKQCSTEEECSFTGILFESLILSVWANRFPTPIGDLEHHPMFQDHLAKIHQMRTRYLRFIRVPITSETIRFQGSYLYAVLHLYAYQKIMIRKTSQELYPLYQHWMRLLPCIRSQIPAQFNLKTQTNIRMSYLHGIMDATHMPQTPTDRMQIIEIKASRATDWKVNALLQALLYGICHGKSVFDILLINVFYKQIEKYHVVFPKGELQKLRSRIVLEIVQWNLNCYLAKNRGRDMHHALILDLDPDSPSFVPKEGEEFFILAECCSPTRVLLDAGLSKEQVLEKIRTRQEIYQTRTLFFSSQISSLPTTTTTPLLFIPIPSKKDNPVTSEESLTEFVRMCSELLTQNGPQNSDTPSV